MIKAAVDLYRFGQKWLIYVQIEKYSQNGNLAIQLFSDSGEPFSTLTTNLSVKLPPNQAYVDTNNNGIEVIDWIAQNGFGHTTGANLRSGFCIYHLVEFDLAKLGGKV
jgi:hypothetical protein